MKQIIDKKVYDTESKTAKELHSWENMHSVSDFHHCEETLYMTERGAFFLAGEGGPLSQYRRSAGNNSWTGGSEIRLLTRDEAIKWLEGHDGSEVIMEHFPDAVEEA